MAIIAVGKTENVEEVESDVNVGNDRPADVVVKKQPVMPSISQQQKEYDIITNTFPRTCPKGQSVELIKASILKKYSKHFSRSDKEHVTKYFYDNSRKFKIKNFTFNGKKKIMKLSIDTKKDLKNILKKFNKTKFKNYSIKL